MRRKYLVVCLLAKVEPEHADIEKAVRHHSGSDFKLAFVHGAPKTGTTVGYVFTSDTHPKDMGFGLLNGDRHIVFELDDVFAESGLNVAGGWLRAHQDRR